MSRTALVVAIWNVLLVSAYVVGHLLTIVLQPVQATAVAFLLGILVYVLAGAKVWRWIRRATRG